VIIIFLWRIPEERRKIGFVLRKLPIDGFYSAPAYLRGFRLQGKSILRIKLSSAEAIVLQSCHSILVGFGLHSLSAVGW
jgi:hypothetical protein